MKNFFILIVGVACGLSLYSCNKQTENSSDRGTASYTYSTTSNKGDYAEWTFDGSTVVATWKEISSTGDVDRTYFINATCGDADATYGYYTCTINSSSSCMAGALTCGAAPTGSFEMLEAPGNAVFVHTSSSSNQLHVGFLKESLACLSDVSGDYVYARTGIGNKDLFGIYRSDSGFLNITHADFEMVAGSASATPVVTYSTTDGTGIGDLALTDGGCTAGVRTRVNGSDTLRSMMTGSGLFVLDMPAGRGGLISFKTTNAASIADFENKTFNGISFVDTGTASPMSLVFGTNTGTAVSISGDVSGSVVSGMSLHPLSDTYTGVTNPAYPDFNAVPSMGTYTYSSNTLQTTYANPGVMPGLFRVDDSLFDSGRIVIAAAKLNGKVIGVGFVYNWRDSSQTNPATGTGYSPSGLYNTGNFIIFERP